MGNSNFLKMHFNLLKIFVTLCMITFMGFGCSSSSSNAPPDTGEEQILEITGADTVIAIIEVGEGPWGVAATPGGGEFVYVTNEKDDNVMIIQTSDNSLFIDPADAPNPLKIPVGDNPNGITVLPDGSKVYVANFRDNNVSVIQTSDNQVVATVEVGTRPINLAASPDSQYVYVSNWGDDTVSVIQTSTDTSVPDPGDPAEDLRIAVGKSPSGIVVSPDGQRVYVANEKENSTSGADDTVSVINTEVPTAPVVLPEVITVGNAPRGIAMSPDGSYVYVANNSDRTTDDGYDSVSIITTLDNSVETIESITKRPEGIAVTPDNFVYVTNWGNRSVSVISALSNIYEGTIQMEYDSSLPIGIAVAVMPDGESYFVYVANNSAEANTVTVLGWP